MRLVESREIQHIFLLAKQIHLNEGDGMKCLKKMTDRL